MDALKNKARWALGALGALALCASAAQAAPVDLAQAGSGFERWQWFCLPESKTIAEGSKKSVPFDIKGSRKSGDLRWVWSGEHPFDPAWVEEARGVIEPTEKIVDKNGPLAVMRLEVKFKEGVFWRGIPVSFFASRYSPQGSFAYFGTSVPRQELAARLARDNPRSGRLFEELKAREEQQASSAEGAQMREVLGKLRQGGQDEDFEPPSPDYVGKFFKANLASPTALANGDRPTPGLTKMGCFNDKGDGPLPPLFEIR